MENDNKDVDCPENIVGENMNCSMSVSYMQKDNKDVDCPENVVGENFDCSMSVKYQDAEQNVPQEG